MKKTKSMIYTALFAALTAVCSVISIPTSPPFTFQTFAVFLSVYTLGAKRAFVSLLIYTAIGLCGVPVFSSMTSGIGVLFGTTGGFLLGFLLMPPVYALAHKRCRAVTASAAALLVCYIFGTVWFMNIYGLEANAVGVLSALQACVLPFILPDIVKTVLAYTLSKRIKPIIRL